MASVVRFWRELCLVIITINWCAAGVAGSNLPALEFIEFKDSESSMGFLVVLEKDPTSGDLWLRGKYGGLYFGNLIDRSMNRLAGEFVPMPGCGAAYMKFTGPMFLAKYPISITLRANGLTADDCSLLRQNSYVLSVYRADQPGVNTVSLFNDPTDSKTLGYLFSNHKFQLKNHIFSVVDRVLHTEQKRRTIFVERRGFSTSLDDAYSLVQIRKDHAQTLDTLEIKRTEHLRADPPRVRFELEGQSFLDMTRQTNDNHKAFLVVRGQKIELQLLERNYANLLRLGYDEMRLLANDFGICEHYFVD